MSRLIKRFPALKTARVRKLTTASEPKVSSIDTETLEKLDAFSNRIGLEFNNKQSLLTSLTHKSFQGNNEDGEIFNLLGQKALQFYCTEYVVNKYPKLPAEVAETIIESFVGQTSLASIAKQFGLQFVIRWKVRFLISCPKMTKSHRLLLEVGLFNHWWVLFIQKMARRVSRNS